MISNWQCIWRGEGAGVAPERERKKGGNITSNVQCCLYIYGAGRNEFDAGKSISRAVGKGWSLKIETFLSPENGNERSECHVGPKTVYFLTYYCIYHNHRDPLEILLCCRSVTKSYLGWYLNPSELPSELRFTLSELRCTLFVYFIAA